MVNVGMLVVNVGMLVVNVGGWWLMLVVNHDLVSLEQHE